jgi:hypothetical protein
VHIGVMGMKIINLELIYLKVSQGIYFNPLSTPLDPKKLGYKEDEG